MTAKMIIEAYCRMRKIDNTIPDDVLDFMKKASLEKLRRDSNENVIVRKGFVRAMDGLESWVDTKTDEMVKLDFKNRDQQLKIYCKLVKITVEIIDDEEFDKD